MSSMGLVEFLRARLDEDEAAARAADLGAVRGAASMGGQWCARVSPYDALPGQAERWFVEDGFEEAVVRRVDADAGDARGQAEHIARHDPARVLADIAAARSIVDLCARTEAPALYTALEALASVHAEHPDYDQAWRS